MKFLDVNGISLDSGDYCIYYAGKGIHLGQVYELETKYIYIKKFDANTKGTWTSERGWANSSQTSLLCLTPYLNAPNKESKLTSLVDISNLKINTEDRVVYATKYNFSKLRSDGYSRQIIPAFVIETGYIQRIQNEYLIVKSDQNPPVVGDLHLISKKKTSKILASNCLSLSDIEKRIFILKMKAK